MILTITNQKGGVAKSTSTQTLGAGLALRGYKVLLIDLDAQANLTIATGLKEVKATSYELLKGTMTAKECITPIKDNLDLIPASLLLSGADLEFTDAGRAYKLKEAIEGIKGEYDFILIDTPPALSILTLNALTVADKVIIPAQADRFSLQAIKQLVGTLNTVRKYTNPALQIDGILLTRYNARNILTQDLTEALDTTAKELHTKLFKARIREAIAIKEAQTVGKDIFEYNASSNVASDYTDFIDEVIKDSIKG